MAPMLSRPVLRTLSPATNWGDAVRRLRERDSRGNALLEEHVAHFEGTSRPPRIQDDCLAVVHDARKARGDLAVRVGRDDDHDDIDITDRLPDVRRGEFEPSFPRDDPFEFDRPAAPEMFDPIFASVPQVHTEAHRSEMSRHREAPMAGAKDRELRPLLPFRTLRGLPLMRPSGRNHARRQSLRWLGLAGHWRGALKGGFPIEFLHLPDPEGRPPECSSGPAPGHPWSTRPRGVLSGLPPSPNSTEGHPVGCAFRFDGAGPYGLICKKPFHSRSGTPSFAAFCARLLLSFAV